MNIFSDSFNKNGKHHCVEALLYTLNETWMNTMHFNKTGLSYSQSVKITDWNELIFISGQVPEDDNEVVPEAFSDQCRLANIERQLNHGGMALDNIMKVTVFLSDRKYREENSKIRQEILGDISPALTIIITGIYEEKWLLEIEAIAAK